MGNYWGIIIALALSCAVARPAPTPCSRRIFREAEIALGRAMLRPGLTLKQPTSVTEEAIHLEDTRTRETLDSLGIKYKVVSDDEARRLNWMTYLGELQRVKQITLENRNHTGHLYRIVAPNERNASATTSFLNHPRWPEFAAKMRNVNVEILIDSSLPLTGAGAYFRRVRPGFIGVSFNNSLSDLAHEMSHAEFLEYRIVRLIEIIRSKVKRGLEVSGYLDNLFFSGFGRERLEQVVALVRAGYPTIAINEWFSARAEIAEIKLSGAKDIPKRIALANRYAISHLLASLGELATKRTLGFEERATFVSALAYYGLQHHYLRLPIELQNNYQSYASRLKDSEAPELGGRDTLENKFRAWKVWYAIERAIAERRKLEGVGEITLGEYHIEMSPAPR